MLFCFGNKYSCVHLITLQQILNILFHILVHVYVTCYLYIILYLDFFWLYILYLTFLIAIFLQNILSAMQAIFQGKTSIFIAHRLSTVVNADEIFVLGEGKVIEQGKHSDLLSSPSSLYSELWARQHMNSQDVLLPHSEIDSEK